MPFYVGDYLVDTTNLNTEQHGAYCLLLFSAWKHGGTLPKAEDQLRSITKLSPMKWRANRALLLGFFKDGGDHYFHKRVTEEHQKAKKNSEKRSISGAKGAEKRWQTDDIDMANGMANAIANGMANDIASPWQNDGPSPSPSEVNNKVKNSTPEKSAETGKSSSPDGDTNLFDLETIATDDKAIAFASGVPALVKLGMADKAARGMVGKAIKEAGEEAAVRICGRLATFENHPNPAALIMALIGEEKDAVFQALRERHGECRKLADGRYQSGSRYFDRDGKQEVSL